MTPSPRLPAFTLGLALLFLPAAGCSGGDDDTGTGDTGGDGGTSGSLCGDYSSAWRTGAEWSWALDPAWVAAEEKDGAWRTVAMGSEDYNGYEVWILQETGEYTSDPYPEEGIQVEWRLACDDTGVRVVQYEGVWSRTNNLGTEQGWWSVDFEEPPVIQPATMAVGDTWTVDTDFTFVTSQTSGANMHLDASFEVTGETSVTVGAGTFDALEVAVEWSGDPRSDFEADSYSKLVAAEVGDVQIVGRANLEEWNPDPQFE